MRGMNLLSNCDICSPSSRFTAWRIRTGISSSMLVGSFFAFGRGAACCPEFVLRPDEATGLEGRRVGCTGAEGRVLSPAGSGALGRLLTTLPDGRFAGGGATCGRFRVGGRAEGLCCGARCCAGGAGGALPAPCPGNFGRGNGARAGFRREPGLLGLFGAPAI